MVIKCWSPTLHSDAPVLFDWVPLTRISGHRHLPLVRGDGLQVHVEGGLAVVLLPPPRTSGGGVHSRDISRSPGLYLELSIKSSGQRTRTRHFWREQQELLSKSHLRNCFLSKTFIVKNTFDFYLIFLFLFREIKNLMVFWNLNPKTECKRRLMMTLRLNCRIKPPLLAIEGHLGRQSPTMKEIKGQSLTERDSHSLNGTLRDSHTLKRRQ